MEELNLQFIIIKNNSRALEYWIWEREHQMQTKAIKTNQPTDPKGPDGTLG